MAFWDAKCTLPRHVELLIQQHSQVLLITSALSPFFAQPLFGLGIAPSHVQVLTPGLVELHDIQIPMLPVCLKSPTTINNIYKIMELILGAKGQVTFQVS